MFEQHRQIRNPYPFRSAERDAIRGAILETLGVIIKVWYQDWNPSADGTHDDAIDHVVFDRANKTQRNQVMGLLLVMMRSQIRLHHDTTSFRNPEEVTIG